MDMESVGEAQMRITLTAAESSKLRDTTNTTDTTVTSLRHRKKSPPPCNTTNNHSEGESHSGCETHCRGHTAEREPQQEVQNKERENNPLSPSLPPSNYSPPHSDLHLDQDPPAQFQFDNNTIESHTGTNTKTESSRSRNVPADNNRPDGMSFSLHDDEPRRISLILSAELKPDLGGCSYSSPCLYGLKVPASSDCSPDVRGGETGCWCENRKVKQTSSSMGDQTRQATEDGDGNGIQIDLQTRRQNPAGAFEDRSQYEGAGMQLPANTNVIPVETVETVHSNRVPTIETQMSEQPYAEKPGGFSSYLWSELSRGYEPDENEAAYNVKRERVYAFLSIPKECEKFMFYGFLQCVDSFLFIFTFLPLRLMIILLSLLIRPWTLCMPHWYLTASQKCDIVKGIIIALGCLAMHQVDASMCYHIIRGQAIIKLYIFFNLLEVGDRLLSSFGQDILDAVMWTVADSKQRSTWVVVGHIAYGTIYVFLHSMLVLLQASALSVAFNSHNKALLTILISNNAVELKGSVFKKFEKTNLFQMSCSDVREIFHLQILILIVCLRNMTDSNWDIEKFVELIPDIVALLLCEIIIDATKHAFITKFNNIPYTVYREYTVLLANDVITSRKKSAFSDVSDQVSRRLGLIPLPLACLLIKIVIQSFKIQTPLAVANACLAFLCLFGAKLVIGVVVYGWAVDYYNEYHKEEACLSKRQRHKSGIDEDLLKCENNYHWYKKPTTTTLQPPSSPDMDRKKLP